MACFLALISFKFCANQMKGLANMNITFLNQLNKVMTHWTMELREVLKIKTKEIVKRAAKKMMAPAWPKIGMNGSDNMRPSLPAAASTAAPSGTRSPKVRRWTSGLSPTKNKRETDAVGNFQRQPFRRKQKNGHCQNEKRHHDLVPTKYMGHGLIQTDPDRTRQVKQREKDENRQGKAKYRGYPLLSLGVQLKMKRRFSFSA